MGLSKGWGGKKLSQVSLKLDSIYNIWRKIYGNLVIVPKFLLIVALYFVLRRKVTMEELRSNFVVSR